MKTPDSISHAQGPHLHSDCILPLSFPVVRSYWSLTLQAFYFSHHVYPVILQKRTQSALQKFIACNKIKNNLNEEIRLKENEDRRNNYEARYAAVTFWRQVTDLVLSFLTTMTKIKISKIQIHLFFMYLSQLSVIPTEFLYPHKFNLSVNC